MPVMVQDALDLMQIKEEVELKLLIGMVLLLHLMARSRVNYSYGKLGGNGALWI